MSISKKILIAAPVHTMLIDSFKNAGYELIIEEHITQEIGESLIKDCVGLITSTRLNVNQNLLDKAPLLHFIGRMGSGMEIIDTTYAQQKNIACYSSPDGNCNAVAEHALGMLLALNKNIVKGMTEIRQGLWMREENRGVELEAKTIGIIGYGHTGSAFVKLLSSFNMTILVYDKYITPPISQYYETVESMDKLYEKADIISLHVPFQDDTLHLINTHFIKSMKKNFTLINTSRGSVVDSRTLLSFLDSGKINGLILDVWEEEPLQKMSAGLHDIYQKLALRDNVILTPHIAGYTHEALYKMSASLVRQILCHNA